MYPAEISNDRVLLVLLVEDDNDTQANLSDILALDGYEILVAGTAKEGRQVARQSNPDVIILDRQLPDANADQLLPELRAIIPRGEHYRRDRVCGHGEHDCCIASGGKRLHS